MAGGTDFSAIGGGLGAIAQIGGGIYSAITGSRDARHIADIQKKKLALEVQEQQQRETQMELSSRRAMTEQVRQAQFARSMALTQATGAESQKSTGLQGAYGSIAGQSGVNQLGISQNLQIGRNLYEETNQISGLNMQLADAQAQMSSDQAWGKLFSNLGSEGSSIGKLASTFLPT